MLLSRKKKFVINLECKRWLYLKDKPLGVQGMVLQLLEIGTQTELLASCRLSLLMGVYTDDNRIMDFLKFVSKHVYIVNV